MPEIVHRLTIIQTEFDIVEDGPNGKYVLDTQRAQVPLKLFSAAEFGKAFEELEKGRQALLAPPAAKEETPANGNGRRPRGRSRRTEPAAAPPATEQTSVN